MEFNEDEILAHASFYKEKEDYGNAIRVLQKGIKDFPNSANINSILGLLLVNQNFYNESIEYLERSISVGNESEIIHLGLYIAYANTDKDEEAIDLLFKYLQNNKADLFKDTLEELVEGLRNGYLTKYKDSILNFAKENNVNYSR